MFIPTTTPLLRNTLSFTPPQPGPLSQRTGMCLRNLQRDLVHFSGHLEIPPEDPGSLIIRHSGKLSFEHQQLIETIPNFLKNRQQLHKAVTRVLNNNFTATQPDFCNNYDMPNGNFTPVVGKYKAGHAFSNLIQTAGLPMPLEHKNRLRTYMLYSLAETGIMPYCLGHSLSGNAVILLKLVSSEIEPEPQYAKDGYRQFIIQPQLELFRSNEQEVFVKPLKLPLTKEDSAIVGTAKFNMPDEYIAEALKGPTFAMILKRPESYNIPPEQPLPFLDKLTQEIKNHYATPEIRKNLIALCQACLRSTLDQSRVETLFTELINPLNQVLQLAPEQWELTNLKKLSSNVGHYGGYNPETGTIGLYINAIRHSMKLLQESGKCPEVIQQQCLGIIILTLVEEAMHAWQGNQVGRLAEGPGAFGNDDLLYKRVLDYEANFYHYNDMEKAKACLGTIDYYTEQPVEKDAKRVTEAVIAHALKAIQQDSEAAQQDSPKKSSGGILGRLASFFRGWF